jgi:proton glutamate symport protein
MPRSPAVWLLIALVLGLGTGVAAGTDPVVAEAVVRLLQPIGTLWLNAIRMTVVPLVVATVLAALLGTGAEHLVRTIGGRALGLLLAMLFVASLFTVIVAPPVISALMPPAEAAALALATDTPQTTSVSFIEWLLELVPVNPVRAAADTAMLPLLIFVILFGLAAARLPLEQRSLIQRGAAAVSAATLVLVRWVLLVAPVGVFALAAVLGTRLGASAAGAVIVYVIVVTALCVLVAAGLYAFVTLSTRYRVRDFGRASAPAQAVALSARSSLASLPAMIEGASRMGMRPGVGSFFLPLAASVFRLGGVVGITTGILFLAHLYGVRIGIAELATIFIAVPLLTFSVPGIPGGSILIMSPVLISVGVPLEGIGILLATDTIPDMVRTAVNVTADMAAATALDAHLPSSTETAA